MRRLPGWILFGFVAWAPLTHLSAAVLEVPGDFPTVRAAVDAALPGDTILISPGTHVGGAFVTGKALTIGSLFLTTGDPSFSEVTILAGVDRDTCRGHSGCEGDSVLEFSDSAGGSVVAGLTLRDGDNGIRSLSPVDVTACRVLANGDGMDYSTGAGGIVRDSLFALNGDDGIDLNGYVEIQVIDNVIVDNGDDGVEFRLFAYSGPLGHVDIVDNVIARNGEDGIQLIDYDAVSDFEIRIEGNLFRSNAMAAVGCMADGDTEEDFSGAPIAERILLLGNTFIDELHGVVGGENLVGVNNLFVGTQASAVRRVRGGSIMAHTLFWNNALDAEQSNVDASTVVALDPLLDEDGSLQAGSPAIDRGTARFVWGGAAVLDLPPAGYSGSAPDLGAREFDSEGPRALPDQAEVDEGDVLQVPAPGVLANDAAPGGALSVVGAVSLPSHGTLALAADGSWEYAHDGSESATDSFVYEVADPDDNRARATVTLMVRPINDPPVPAVDSFLVDLGSIANLLDVLYNDTDPDAGDAPSLLSVEASWAGGAVALSGSLVSYTPPEGFTGYDRFRYTIRDTGGARSQGLAFVSVQDITVTETAVKVSASAGDVEESASGSVSGSSSDLELAWDGSAQRVGLRFPGVQVPRGAQIMGAWIQFRVDEATTEPTDLLVFAQDSDNAPVFAITSGSVSSRPLMPAGVPWSPPGWPVVGTAGPDQRTSDLSSLVSALVRRPGWAAGQAMAFVITGTGRRVAESYDGGSAYAPQLVVRYVMPPPLPPNTPPSVEAGPDLPLPGPGSLILPAAVHDDGLPAPPSAVSLVWSQVSGTAPVTFVLDSGGAGTSAVFPLPGTYVLQLRAHDGEMESSDTLRVMVGMTGGNSGHRYHR